MYTHEHTHAHSHAGSVAAIKLPVLCQLLGNLGDVKVISTESARHFMAKGAPLPTIEGLEFLHVRTPSTDILQSGETCTPLMMLVLLLSSFAYRTRTSGTAGNA